MGGSKYGDHSSTQQKGIICELRKPKYATGIESSQLIQDMNEGSWVKVSTGHQQTTALYYKVLSRNTGYTLYQAINSCQQENSAASLAQFLHDCEFEFLENDK